jgi:hypothetical protein
LGIHPSIPRMGGFETFLTNFGERPSLLKKSALS